MKRYPTVLTIAGSDSSGGAGIQADLKTIAALGAYGASAITALTAQNTQGVKAIHPVPADFLKEQLDAIFEDLIVDAVKIGMINTVEAAVAIAEILDRYKPEFVVFDPVMVSTSGSKLIENETIAVLWKELFPRVDLITPNLDEGQILISGKIDSVELLKEAAEEMVRKGCKAVLLKGGHLVAPTLSDVFARQNEETLILESGYIASSNLHGTGCTLSSAIATYMALGNSLPEAIIFAKKYISEAIEAGKDVKTGHGPGPLNHSFSPINMQFVL
ncbi:bifunctional hydroxymethylpyrimidine kinase/phosphomethylpyrimidine kinase [Dyadobacter sediminis]|uniref:hydroxymethylpyrimidine kinase n=1 Tax=Dyadobacter sediminis TaxID=1493691 RepID=A0A5R9KA87_9BACT|nr:bifunctional hydroxymethylpyrimidine kinase/phosphomethylpyrimidine kinase [Dyadobacter sediminis]TLU91685.1 bifunctional hydroxymethylpyrimidine kinase/phosphomethylpyrimidine kinase [Dyadobacter sediminis]GGC01230.1 hydroxymethylpyrimidine/phosphomethylpyrimidine kinase [Dyadobacter sediminis]